MQSLFTVNNNVSLVSITIAPSAWIASLVLSLIFAFVYLVYQSPLLSVRWTKLFSFTRRRQPQKQKLQKPAPPIIEEYDDYYYDDDTLSEEEQPPRRRHIEHTPLPPLITDYPYPFESSSLLVGSSPILLDDSSRESPKKEKPDRKHRLRNSDKRASSSSGRRTAARDSGGGRGSGLGHASRHDGIDNDNSARPSRAARRVTGRLRAIDWEPEPPAVRLPVGPLGLPERRHGERDGRLGLGGFRRWLQSARLEAPRQRRPQQRLLAEG